MSKHLKASKPSLIKELLEKCLYYSSRTEATQDALLEEFKVLSSLVEKLILLEKGQFTAPEREKHFDEFVKWCQAGGLDFNNYEIQKVNKGFHEYGLYATNEIHGGSLIMSIPYQLLLSTETSLGDPILTSIANEDPVLKTMPNVLLSFHLMCEYCRLPASRWKPYLNILPSSYSTPPYYSESEMRLTKGSSALSEAVKLCRNIYRQYAYFWLKINSKGSSSFKKLPLKNFCFEFYRWAISTVMTRQNILPSSSPIKSKTALIPLWDMCNHEEGQFSTDYDLENKKVLCFAMRKFSPKEEITMFYGSRTNCEFLVNNGFVVPKNSYDALSLRLGFSRSDPLFKLRSQLAELLEVPSSGMFMLREKCRGYDDNLIKFIRVFTSSKAEIENTLDEVSNNQMDRKISFSVPNEAVMNFLETRCQILLRGYPSFPNESKISQIGEKIAALVESEKNILLSHIANESSQN